MKVISLLTLLLTLFVFVRAQQIYIETGKSISSFDYKNTQGKKLDNLQSTGHTYISLGYKKNIYTKNLFLNVTGSYSGYGATGSDDALGNYFSWNLHYLGLGAGLDYKVYKTGDFSFYIKGAASAEFLIQGTQTLNNQVFNLTKEEEFRTPAYFFRGGLGTQYKASDKFSFFTQYTYGRGGMFKKPQGNLKINDHRFGAGLLINISKKSPSATNATGVPQLDESQLNEFKRALENNSQKIKELEANNRKIDSLKKELAVKEREIAGIKQSIANALQPYSGADLNIKDVDGKLYITMGNDMLFTSGSSKPSAEGIKAINDLGQVLEENKELNIVVVGHTDNRPFRNSATNNWDLSVKRATEVVELLTHNKDIDPKSLTAAGKGAQEPIADNETAAGRKQNRRIEIIISPNLEKLSELTK